MSLHTHTLETKAEERMCPLTSFPFPLFFTLSFFLLYVHTPHPPIPVFLSLTLYVKDPLISRLKHKDIFFPSNHCVYYFTFEWLTHPCQMEFFTWLCHQACGEFARAFNQTSLQDVWEFSERGLMLDSVIFTPAITRGLPTLT